MADPPGEQDKPAAGVGPTLPRRDDPRAFDETAPLPRLPEGEGELNPGVRLGGRYRLEKPLGVGGMGAVWLAADEALGKRVALKFVRPELAGAGALTSLAEEVTVAQRVTHPNVCRIDDLEQIDGRALIKMEYVAGETLAERLAGGPLTVEEAVPIARAITAGLAAAHAQGVVHRDLKPQNVMIEKLTGRVVLMDFGLARAVRSGEAVREGSSGTPEYMAPEQARGANVDERADLFSLGALLYHGVVGQVPFPEAREALQKGQPLERQPPDPRARRPDLPSWLAKLILQLLEPDPAARPATALAVQLRLAGPPRRWPLAVAALVVIAAAGGASLLIGRIPERRPWQPHLADLPAWDENADMPSFSPDGKEIAYLSDRDGDWRIYVEPVQPSGPSRAVTPAKLDGQGLDPDLPHWGRDGRSIVFVGAGDRAYRVALDGSPPVTIAERVRGADECGEGRLALVELSSPDCASCQRLVVRRREGAVKQLLELGSDEAIDFLRCDVAGREVVVTRAPLDPHKVQRPGDVWRVPVDGGEPRKLTAERERDRYPPYPAFSPDGKSVVFSSARGGHTNLWEVAIAGGGAPVQITTGTGPDLAPAVSPDGTRLIYDSDDTAVPIFARVLSPDGAAGGADRRIAPTLDDVATIVASPDGREVVASVRSQGGRRIVAVPLAGGDERAIAEGDTPALTSDGREVVWSAEFGGKTRLLAAPLDGAKPPREIAALDGRVTALHAGPDGALHLTRALAGGAEVWRVALAGGAPEREVAAPIAEVVPAPRGDYRIALVVRGATVDVAHVIAPGKPLDDPGARTLSVRLVAWAADGASFLYWDGSALHRYTVATADDRSLGAAKDLEGLALAPDGKTAYLSAAVGHVRRRLIDNFAERTRPPGVR